MLALDTSYSFSGVPYITYEALYEYAERVAGDFMPLTTPKVLDVEKFVEYYLNLQIDYKRLSGARQVLGLTVFNDGVLNVLDETGQSVPIKVQEGTVIIDPVLTERRNLPRKRFTFMHEGSHWLLHRKAFSGDNPFSGTPGTFDNPFIAAKEGRVDYRRSNKERNDNDRIERQADFLTSALLMPKVTLRMAFVEFFERYADKPRTVVRGKSELDDIYAEQLPKYIAQQFGVSKRAALIRLEKLNAITGKQNRQHQYYVNSSTKEIISCPKSNSTTSKSIPSSKNLHISTVVHGSFAEIEPIVAFRREGSEVQYQRKLLKCPHCASRLTDMDTDTRVELYAHEKQVQVKCQFYIRCHNCRKEEHRCCTSYGRAHGNSASAVHSVQGEGAVELDDRQVRGQRAHDDSRELERR